jgi:hypothetical protein
MEPSDFDGRAKGAEITAIAPFAVPSRSRPDTEPRRPTIGESFESREGRRAKKYSPAVTVTSSCITLNGCVPLG